MQSEGRCHQVPRLPRKEPRRRRRQTGTKRATRASPVPQVPRLPRKVTVDVTNACHAKRRSMSPSATPATQTAAATTAANGNQARHQSQPSAVSATPAPQSEGRCHHKCHACHAKRRSMSPSATPATQRAAATTAANGNQARHQSQPSAASATPATQSDGRCHQVPRLPCKAKVDVTNCHACHAKSRGDTVGKREARHQSQPSAVSATPAPQSEGRCHHKCHACHAKRRSMSPSATPATQRAAATTAANGNQARHQSQPSAASATPATQSDGRCHQVPRLPCKAKVDVTNCHACHAKSRGDNVGKREARHQSQPSAVSATPATESEGLCDKGGYVVCE